MDSKDNKKIDYQNSLTEEKLIRITEQYSRDELILSDAYIDGGIDPLWGRFERAVINQIGNGEAVFSRYAIWANTVRDNIVEGLNLLNIGDSDKAKQSFIRAVNSMSAFADVQAFFDPMELGKKR